jgi:hypothetical protein
LDMNYRCQPHWESGETPAGHNCGPEGPQPGDRRPMAGRPEGRLAAEGGGWLPEWIRLIQ